MYRLCTWTPGFEYSGGMDRWFRPSVRVRGLFGSTPAASPLNLLYGKDLPISRSPVSKMSPNPCTGLA